MALDQGLVLVLVLLDRSAALDTVENQILLCRQENILGIKGIASNWFESYLSEQYQFVYK